MNEDPGVRGNRTPLKALSDVFVSMPSETTSTPEPEFWYEWDYEWDYEWGYEWDYEWDWVK